MNDYYLGLDMGTNSVGWAVTNPEYELLRAKGKDMWGIREFDAANGAVDRRKHRISRRSLQRKQAKIALLKTFFADAIEKEDPNFYARMENSFYHEEDKADCVKSKYALFAEKNYTDQDYYKEYPTIFHLKYDLIKDVVPIDNRYVRKLYLALLHYFEKRGHFLNKSLSSDAEGTLDISDAMTYLCDILRDTYDIEIDFSDVNKVNIKNIFANTSFSRTKKLEALATELKINNKKSSQYLVLKAITGLRVDLVQLLALENDQKVDLEFASSTFDEKLPDILAAIGEEYSELIEVMKSVYDAGVLTSIMDGVSCLSEARIRDYEKHKNDKKLLKDCIKKYCGIEEYNYLFRSDEDGTYSAYVDSVNSGKKVRRGEKLHKSKSGERWEKLKKRIIKDLQPYESDPIVAQILEDVQLDYFLPKQLTYANGVIPNQLHEREMRQILSNAEKHVDFLKQKDASGLTISEKILSLFTFQIPYYIGPTSQNYKGNGWAIRRPGMENEKIYPWNIKDVIDYGLTSEAFILRMVRDCSYLAGEQVLPKESMEYQAFMVLNTINALKINGEKITIELKQDIYRDLFEKKNKVTKKNIADYLCKRGLLHDISELTGVDTTIGCSLASYHRFYGVFGTEIEKDYCKAMIEKIIFWGTVFGDEKDMLKEQILKNFADKLNEKQIKRVLGFKFRDWGNLSKQFLELNGCDTETGESVSLIRTMWNENLNLQELLNCKRFTFKEELESKRIKATKILSEFTYEDLADTYYSAPVKRMIWQTIQIIQEVVEIQGHAPQKIFVEMTRSEEEKKGEAGRKESREKELLELYKSIKEDRSWDEEIKAAGSDGRLRSKKMYLYYKQKGRDMYTGEEIELSELFDDNKYDIDHIYPRHFVKDDSIHNNLVLVNKQKNSRKSDNYPIDASIRNNPEVCKLWTMLRHCGFINEEKYRRLTGTKSFSEEQKADFIARQLVETSQATKGVNDLLKEIMPEETTIVYAKAKNVSEFRQEFDIPKCRLINDFHHAHDAYLNIVVGNAYYTKFTSNPLNFIKKENGKYHLGKMFRYDIVRNGYHAWSAPIWDKDDKNKIVDEGKSLKIVRQMLKKNTPLLTRLCTTQKGAISDATIYSHTKAKEGAYLPIKGNENELLDVTKYGGFNSAKNAYYFLVEHEIEGKGKNKGLLVKTRTIECLPIYKRHQVESKPDGLYQYCLELGLKNPSVRVKMIKPQSLINLNGFPIYITGKTGNQFVVRNACNLVLNTKWTKYIHNLEKCQINQYIPSNITEELNEELYRELMSKHCDGFFKNKPTPISESILNGYVEFEKLNLEQQIFVLLQILNISKICDSAVADLRYIGGSSSAGASRMSKCISSYDRVELINQSITGLYSKKVDLLTV